MILDPAAAKRRCARRFPAHLHRPVGAQLGFDAATASFVVTAALSGAASTSPPCRARSPRVRRGRHRIDLPPAPHPRPRGPTSWPRATAAQAEGLLDTAGFYIGDDAPCPSTARRRLIAHRRRRPSTALQISADAGAIQPFVDGLPAVVNRAPVASTTIVNASGRVLSTPTEGVVGRSLDSTDGIAAAYADQLTAGNAVYTLPHDGCSVATTNTWHVYLK